ncbi:MAG: GPR endopeptidase [Firmicutes bacterium]|nr:GPR endopeptidase [Bacillota bacterium]
MNKSPNTSYIPDFDLAIEAGAALRGDTEEEIPGVIEEITEGNRCRTTEITITEEIGAALMKRPIGKYITTEAIGDLYDEACREEIIQTLCRHIRAMLPQGSDDTILLCGIGNPKIASDALGEETISRITPTRHLKDLFSDTEREDIEDMRPIALFAPNVLGNTGMEASELIRAVVKEIRPAAIIVIDALATVSGERLGTSFQLTDTGISPGGGIGNHRPAINEETCGVPVIAVGIPTVIYPHAIVTEVITKMKEKEPALIRMIQNDAILPEVMSERLLSCAVTPKDIDLTVELLADILAESIEGAVHP